MQGLRDDYAFLPTNNDLEAPPTTKSPEAPAWSLQSLLTTATSTVSSFRSSSTPNPDPSSTSSTAATTATTATTAATALPSTSSDEQGNDVATPVENGGDPFLTFLGLSWPQRLAAFGLLLFGGVVFLALAVLYAPLIIAGRSSKFAVTYVFANVSLLASSCVLVGPRRQMASMFAAHRLYASIVYLGSMVGVMYSAWQIRTMWVIVPMLVCQFAALLWYALSYFPYGQKTVRVMTSFLCRRRWWWPM